MKKILLLISLIPFAVEAQNNLNAVIKSESTKALLAGASIKIKKLKINKIAVDGVVTINNIPNGKYDIEVSFVGYKEVEKTISFPINNADTIVIYLSAEAQQLDDVTVTSTRSNRSIRNTPARVEVIAEEEVNEEAAMRPGDIRMLLAESTGIQTQQTSATTANASIRIQGLDGRYTQILKDGFPVFSGAASGLGLLQTPPLDLRQVEIIKGSSSTLYGGGAIAGLVNLISKIPTIKKVLNLQLNVTSAGGLDINSFYSKRFKKTGITLFISRNSNKAYDPANINFSAIPLFTRYTINPKLFLYLNERTTLNFGVNTTFETRLGGDMQLIAGKGDSTHSYFERNKTNRLSTQLTLDHVINDKSSFKFKNSISYFNRIIGSNNYNFNGTQYSSFSEATFINKKHQTDWVVGINLLTDQFKEKIIAQTMLKNYSQTTLGGFVQNTYNVSSAIIVETGFRADYIKDYGVALLPRISALFKFTPHFTSRIGGGLGYKPPTVFTEETERLLYKNVLPVSPQINKLERSYGANWDFNYRTTFDKINLSINQFFFFTYLKSPLFLASDLYGTYRLQNSTGNIITKGAETNVKIGIDELSLYLGYTFTDTKTYNNAVVTNQLLTPKHRFNAALVFEIEGKWKFGSELYYFSNQQLSNGGVGKAYWLSGLVAERIWKHYSIFINFENFADIRQTRFESIYTGSVTNPVFKQIYAPLEGFIVNGGVKIKL